MKVKTIGVVGAGTMGRGIAYAALAGGFRTLLVILSEIPRLSLGFTLNGFTVNGTVSESRTAKNLSGRCWRS